MESSAEELNDSKKVDVDDVVHAVATGPVEQSARRFRMTGSASGVESAPIAMIAVGIGRFGNVASAISNR